MDGILIVAVLWLAYREVNRQWTKLCAYFSEKAEATQELIQSSKETVKSHKRVVDSQDDLVKALEAQVRTLRSMYESKPNHSDDKSATQGYVHLQPKKSIKRTNVNQSQH